MDILGRGGAAVGAAICVVLGVSCHRIPRPSTCMDGGSGLADLSTGLHYGISSPGCVSGLGCASTNQEVPVHPGVPRVQLWPDLCDLLHVCLCVCVCVCVCGTWCSILWFALHIVGCVTLA
jgi:hypothetical protein